MRVTPLVRENLHKQREGEEAGGTNLGELTLETRNET